MKSNLFTIPTDFRFLLEEEAKRWYTTTNEWYVIDQIHLISPGFYKMSSTEIAWISFDIKDAKTRFEFKYNEDQA